MRMNFLTFLHQPQGSFRKGFTLIEMLLAILFFSLAMVALQNVAARSIRVSQNALDQTTAQFLAQEGAELFIHRRDGNMLRYGSTGSVGGWIDGLTVCEQTGSNVGCQAEALQSIAPDDVLVFSGCGATACDGLRVNNATGEYGYSASGSFDRTPFTRTIYYTTSDPTTPPQYITLHSVVTWERNGVPYEVSVVRSLTNWFRTI